MIEIGSLKEPYYCRTKDLLWAHETKQMFELLLNYGKTITEIKELIEKENIFNAASISRAREIRQAITRRNLVVDDEFRRVYLNSSTETQKVMCIILIMLTDHTFYEFMDCVFKEKLITGNLKLTDTDVIGFIHDIQAKDDRAAKWSDIGIRKMRSIYLVILRDAELLSKDLKDKKLLKPLLSTSFIDYLNDNGLSRIREILIGERA